MYSEKLRKERNKIVKQYFKSYIKRKQDLSPVRNVAACNTGALKHSLSTGPREPAHAIHII